VKKLIGSVRFCKPKTRKTEPNPNQKKIGKKLSQTGKKPSQTEKTEPSRFEPVSVFLKKNRFGYVFFIKTEPNRK
jgi:hypothetical protein